MGCIFIHDDYPITVGLWQFSEYTGLKCCICDVLFDMSSLMYFIAKPFRLYLNHLDFHLFFISFQKMQQNLWRLYWIFEILWCTGNLICFSFVHYPSNPPLPVAKPANAGIGFLWPLNIFKRTVIFRIILTFFFLLNYSLCLDRVHQNPGFTKWHAGLFGCSCPLHCKCSLVTL